MNEREQKAAVAEEAAVLAGLQRGWLPFRPVADTGPVDLTYQHPDGRLVRCQVRCAWSDARRDGNWVVDNRTNGKPYGPDCFDYALIYNREEQRFWLVDATTFCSYSSMMRLRVGDPTWEAWWMVDTADEPATVVGTCNGR